MGHYFLDIQYFVATGDWPELLLDIALLQMVPDLMTLSEFNGEGQKNISF